MATIQSMYTYELWRQVNTIIHIPRRACAAKLILLCLAIVYMEFRQKGCNQNLVGKIGSIKSHLDFGSQTLLSERQRMRTHAASVNTPQS